MLQTYYITFKRLSKGSFRSCTSYAVILLSMLAANTVLAQRTVIVEPDNYPAQVGALNVAIEGDTTANGERVDENTIYVLRKDGVYWLDATIQGTGYTIHIEAEEGDGHPPILRPAVTLTGSSSSLFQPRGDFTLKGLYLSHIDENGALQKNPIRISGENARVIIANCWFDYDEQSWVRVDNSNQKIYITNSQGRNNGRNDGSNNGRIIDTRGIDVDTLLLENNTFYNHAGHGLRTDEGVIKYLKINHNTFADIGSIFDFSKSIEVEFTNNLLINVGFFGYAYSSSVENDVSIFRFSSAKEIEGISDSDRKISITNNNFERSIDQIQHEVYGNLFGPYRTEIQSIFDSKPDTIVNNFRFMNDMGQDLIELEVLTMSDNIIESEIDLSFENRPDFQTLVDFIDHKYNNPDDVDGYPLMWDNFDTRVEGSSTADWRNFSYSTSAESYTAAQGGYPIGDLNWFPDKLAQWQASGGVVSNEFESEVTSFRLNQNYPNPFNPNTNISFELSEAEEVSLEVFDMLGRKVQMIASGKFNSGVHTFSFDASSLSSGIYMARLSLTSGSSRTIRMTLIK